MSLKIEITGRGDISIEDGGMAQILEVSNDDSDVFVRLQSWNDDGKHTELDRLVGKKLKITVEVIE